MPQNSVIDQPDPIHNEFPTCWESVIVKMRQRDTIGRKRYGTPLQPFNGRNSLRDLSEELLDAIVYSEQLQMELACLGKDLQNLHVRLAALQSQGTEDIADIVSSVESLLSKYSVLIVD
jgi:hypothetical protein